MTPAADHALGAAVTRFIGLGLRDNVLLLALGLELELREHPSDAKWVRAAGRVYDGTARAPQHWLSGVLRRDLPRHVPVHEQPDGPVLRCVAPMIRRLVCGREISLRPWSSQGGTAIPVLVGEHVSWYGYCKQHDHEPHPEWPAWKVRRCGTPEAYEAAKRLRHNTGGQLRDAFPGYRFEDGYRWADRRWEPDDRPVEPVRLRLVPPVEPATREES